MAQKVLSVSIAAYNVQSTLEAALLPFTDSEVRDKLDVMIINDGSTDRTAEIAQHYVNRYPDTFRLINKKNGGWGSTLNTGFQCAIGKYFKQLDGDDFFSPENLNDFLNFLDKRDEDMVYTPYVTFEDQTGAAIRVVGGYFGNYRFFPLEKTVNLKECSGFCPAMHCLTIRTDILKNNPILITEHCFYTDVEYVLKAYNYCETITFAKWPIYWYRLARSGQSMSRKGVQKHYRDHQKMLITMLEYLNTAVTKEYVAEVIRNRLLGVCNMQYIFYFALECTKKQKDELREFDKLLKDKYPYFYKEIDGKQIVLLRKTHFNGYKIIAMQKMNKDKRLKQNIFEGC